MRTQPLFHSSFLARGWNYYFISQMRCFHCPGEGNYLQAVWSATNLLENVLITPSSRIYRVYQFLTDPTISLKSQDYGVGGWNLSMLAGRLQRKCEREKTPSWLVVVFTGPLLAIPAITQVIYRTVDATCYASSWWHKPSLQTVAETSYSSEAVAGSGTFVSNFIL